MGHDQLFKAILEKFFKDFLELFFPSVAERLDFGTWVFLDKELFADLPQGPTREVDVVARLETYSKLSERERARFERLLSRKEYRTVQEGKRSDISKGRPGRKGRRGQPSALDMHVHAY